MTRIWTKLQRLAARFGNERGATAVEFALVAAPLVALTLAGVQTAIIYFFDQTLQTATEKSARSLMTGNAQLAGMTQTQFLNLVCTNAPVFTCANLMVDVESASSFSSISTTPLTPTYNAQGQVTNTWGYSPGGPGDIVIVRVMYNWPVVGGPLSLNLANQANGDYLIQATSVFKNEPYQ